MMMNECINKYNCLNLRYRKYTDTKNNYTDIKVQLKLTYW